MTLRNIRDHGANVRSWVKVQYYRLMGIKIGENCWISSDARVDVRRGKITIGNKVNISGGAYILGHAAYQPKFKDGQATTLEDNVIIFVNAVVLPGVTVGRNSIVGAGSVVGKNVPPNVIVMGNPARVVKHLEEKKI